MNYTIEATIFQFKFLPPKMVRFVIKTLKQLSEMFVSSNNRQYPTPDFNQKTNSIIIE